MFGEPRAIDVNKLLEDNPLLREASLGVRSFFRITAGALELKPNDIVSLASIMIVSVLNEFHQFLKNGEPGLTDIQAGEFIIKLMHDIANSLQVRVDDAVEEESEDEDDGDNG